MDYQIVDLLKWAGPSAAFILYVLKELKERRQLDAIIGSYEQISRQYEQQLTVNTEALTRLCDRIDEMRKREPSLIEHLTYNTQALTRLCERIEALDRRMSARGGT